MTTFRSDNTPTSAIFQFSIVSESRLYRRLFFHYGHNGFFVFLSAEAATDTTKYMNGCFHFIPLWFDTRFETESIILNIGQIWNITKRGARTSLSANRHKCQYVANYGHVDGHNPSEIWKRKRSLKSAFFVLSLHLYVAKNPKRVA